MTQRNARAVLMVAVLIAGLFQACAARAALLNLSGSNLSSTDFTLNGSAAATSNGSVQLTNGGSYEAGSMFTNQKVGISSFTASYEFQLLNGTNPSADGITFCIQNSGVNALGQDGGGLGYSQDPSYNTGAVIGQSVAVKFDLYSNSGEGIDSTGLYTDGAEPTTNNSINLSGAGINLHSQDPFLVTMTYSNSLLQVNLLDLVTNIQATQSYAVNIAQVVGGNTAYMGFTGGTGGLSADQLILNATVSNTPEPSALALLAGLMTFGLCLRRKRMRLDSAVA